jgi:integrase
MTSPIENALPRIRLCDSVPPQRAVESMSQFEGGSLARRRYQKGNLTLRGKGKKWVAKWREDVIETSGLVRRIQKREVIGTLKEYPTRKLAQRALDQRLSGVNSLTYKPSSVATFAEFSTKWQRDVLSQHKRSTQSADRSRIKKHLIPELGEKCMKDINRELLQSIVARKSKSLSAKSVRNLFVLLREMWVQGKADGYSQIDPFIGLVLPECGLVDEPCLTLNEMKLLIDSAKEPYKTFYWILAETGIRCGEACGLPVKNLLLDHCAIKIRQKVWHGKIETVKSKKGNRTCEISPQLTEHLRGYLRSWRPNRLGLLFATANGTPWDADALRKRKFYPLLAKLELTKCGFHAFRHGNETVMDGEGVPMATRQNRLGHSNAHTTMNYTHMVSEDGRKIAARLGELLTTEQIPVASMGNA